MAGALHVRIVEVPESMRARRPAASLGGVHPGGRRVVLADPPPEVAVSFSLPFDEAVDDFLARDIVTPEQWRSMDAAARRRAFTATQLASDQLRQRAYDALLRSLAEGTTLREFSRDLRSGELSLGVTPSDPAYAETIFRTNTATAYAAGRFQQMQQPEVLEARPYVQFRAILDDRTTKRCSYCDGLIFDRRSDPGWVRFAPPLHFNCRSTTVALGPRDVSQSQVVRSSSVDARGYPAPGFGGAPDLDLEE